MQKPTVTTMTVAPEAYLYVLGMLSDPSLMDVKKDFLKGWFFAKPEVTQPAPVLPEISFDHQGWSQQIKGAGNVWFLIRRVGAGRYVLAEATGRTATPVLSYAGILTAATARVLGEVANPPALRLETVTDDDRRTNFGAF